MVWIQLPFVAIMGFGDFYNFTKGYAIQIAFKHNAASFP